MKRKYYIAYGSNLNTEQMISRCPDAIAIGSATIDNYELLFRGNGRRAGVATIEPCAGKSVPVGIWSISERDEASLDRYEGWPYLYEKQTFRVKINGKTIRAMAYIMTPGHMIAQPMAYYLNTIAEGYYDFGFDTDILFKAVQNSRRRLA